MDRGGEHHLGKRAARVPSKVSVYTMWLQKPHKVSAGQAVRPVRSMAWGQIEATRIPHCCLFRVYRTRENTMCRMRYCCGLGLTKLEHIVGLDLPLGGDLLSVHATVFFYQVFYALEGLFPFLHIRSRIEFLLRELLLCDLHGMLQIVVLVV